MKRIVLFSSVLLLCAAVVYAGDEPPRAQFPGVVPRGPQVEVALRNGRASFACFLTGYKNGAIDFQMLSGEARQERAADVASIRFLSGQPEGNAPAGPDPRRIRDLIERDQSGVLTPEETDELFRLREKAPVFNGDPGPLERRIVARKLAQREESKGRMERYIGMYQQRLKRVETEEDARDVLMALTMAYLQKGMLPGKMKDQLQRDMQNIADPEIRRRVEHVAEGSEPGPVRRKEPK